MARHGIAVRRVRMQPTAGGIGMPTKSGGRRTMAGSAAASRVAAIESGSASDGRRSRLPLNRPPRLSARVSTSRRFGKISLCPARLLRVVRARAVLSASAVLRLLVPQRFTASDPARTALGTTAETWAVKSPPDSAVAQESTSPHIVGPCQADLSWFQRCAEECSDFIKRNDLRARATVQGR